MPLTFDASGEKINVTQNASVNNNAAFTFACWINLVGLGNGLGNDSQILGKSVSGTARQRVATLITNSEFDCQIGRASGNAIALAPVANFTAYDVNKWIFLVCQCDTATAGNNRIFVGDRTTLAAEPSAYTGTPTNGSGAQGDDSGTDFQIGSNGGAQFTRGDIAFVGYWNRALSTGEIHDQQFHPHVTNGCKVFMFPGWSGTSTVPDWSGTGNTGTVTGATQSTNQLGNITSPFSWDHMDGWFIAPPAGSGIPVKMVARRFYTG